MRFDTMSEKLQINVFASRIIIALALIAFLGIAFWVKTLPSGRAAIFDACAILSPREA